MLNLFTAPPEKPFLDILAAHLLNSHGGDPLGLSRVLVLLPNRRSCRSLREVILKQSGGTPMLLPRIQPVGDVEEEEIFNLHAIDQEMEVVAQQLLPTIPRLKRHLLLTRLVSQFYGSAHDNAHGIVQAAQLAMELARFFDAVEREQLGFDALASLVPADFSEHWQLTLKFLSIITNSWPELLMEQQVEDPIRRRNALVEGLALFWQKHPPDAQVILAGSTGSQPVTAQLIKTVASMPNGLVLLPASDRGMPEDVWEALEETHPQYVFKTMLSRTSINRSDIRLLDIADIPPSCSPERLCLLQEALKPATLTDSWRDCEVTLQGSLQNVSRIECSDLQCEAKTIAVVLREVLEVPGKTAAVVTKDRNLARMIVAMMERYGVVIDDSAGKPLSDTRPAVFLRLMADMGLSRAAPVPLLSLLKHPLAAGNRSVKEMQEGVEELELAVLRGTRPMPGLSTLTELLRIHEPYPEKALALFEKLYADGQEFLSFFEQRRVNFEEMLKSHLAFAENMSGSSLWLGEEGEQLAEFFTHLLASAPSLGTIDPSAYPSLLDAFLAGHAYRPAQGAHPRLHIFSPQEARLEPADVMIIAGLNEGVWPPAAEGSPWMSRPMQKKFGLPLPESSVGRAAHDFLMIASAKEVILTRALKTDGSPTVPSRWLLRLDTLLQSLSPGFSWPDTPYPGWNARLEMPDAMPAFIPPAPRPPVSARPRKLSVTQIEKWMRDPYAIYASKILKLQPLEPLDREPDASVFGHLIHASLEQFILAYPDTLPVDAYGELLSAGKPVFAPFWEHAAVRAFWWPRYEAIATWLAGEEYARRNGLLRVEAEIGGGVALHLPGGMFTITARIDRLEIAKDGGITIVDYKTGAVATTKDIHSGLAAQLPLSAFIAEKGKINPPLPQGSIVNGLEFWKLGGEAELNDIKALGTKNVPLRMLIDEAEAGVSRLIAVFNDASTPYLACPDPAIKPRYNDYEQLERLAEWGAQ